MQWDVPISTHANNSLHITMVQQIVHERCPRTMSTNDVHERCPRTMSTNDVHGPAAYFFARGWCSWTRCSIISPMNNVRGHKRLPSNNVRVHTLSPVTNVRGRAFSPMKNVRRHALPPMNNVRRHAFSPVPAGSPSHGEDVVVYVKDINQPSLPTPFVLFLCLFLSLWPFQLYFIP